MKHTQQTQFFEQMTEETQNEINKLTIRPNEPITEISVSVNERSEMQLMEEQLYNKVQLSKQLTEFVNQNNLSVEIQGTNYLMVNGWQFALSLLGVSPIVTETKDLSIRNHETGEYIECSWYASCNLVEDATGKVLGRGDAICSNRESKKKSFDPYSILSMAQTRAIGKAARNKAGWLAMAAGFDATPLEEIDGLINAARSPDELTNIYRLHKNKLDQNPDRINQLAHKKAQFLKQLENDK